MKLVLENDEDRAVLLEKLAARIAQNYTVHEKIEKLIERRIAEAVDAAIVETAKAVSREQLEPMIKEILAGDQLKVPNRGYYSNEPSPKTLRQIIGDFFSSRDNSSRSWVQELAEKAIAESLKKEFEPQIKAAGAELRRRIDELLGAKVAIAMREALGLR